MAKKTKYSKGSGGLNTSYLTKMGLHNLVANRSMSFSSISVLTACLLLIGISFSLLLNMQSLVKDVEKQNVVLAFVENNADEASTVQVGTDLSVIPNVTNVEFVSKEEAFNEQLQEYGVDKDLFDGIISNPLPDTYRITVSNLDEFTATLEQIRSVNNVSGVRESQELVNQISTMQKSITLICIVIVAVLAVVSLFIIANTIRITMVSRKVDIQVMKSVGATNIFICWPFMIEGIIIGLISGVVSLILTYFVQRFEGDSLNTLFAMFGSSTIPVGKILPYMTVCYLIAGILLGSLGSVFSIRKYLKKEGSEASFLD